jgi:hypothetical protein
VMQSDKYIDGNLDVLAAVVVAYVPRASFMVVFVACRDDFAGWTSLMLECISSTVSVMAGQRRGCCYLIGHSAGCYRRLAG